MTLGLTELLIVAVALAALVAQMQLFRIAGVASAVREIHEELRRQRTSEVQDRIAAAERTALEEQARFAAARSRDWMIVRVIFALCALVMLIMIMLG